jgi:hypothetical protein
MPTARPPIGFPLPPVFLRIIFVPLFTETFTEETFFFGWTFFFNVVTFFFALLEAVVGFFVAFGAALMSASRD